MYMPIKIKDPNKLKEAIVLEGYSLIKFSAKLKKCRSYINNALRNRTIGPESAKKICKVLGTSFETHFELVKESNNVT